MLFPLSIYHIMILGVDTQQSIMQSVVLCVVLNSNTITYIKDKTHVAMWINVQWLFLGDYKKTIE